MGFDLMMEYGNHVQTVAIDAARSVEDSSFLRERLRRWNSSVIREAEERLAKAE